MYCCAWTLFSVLTRSSLPPFPSIEVELITVLAWGDRVIAVDAYNTYKVKSNALFGHGDAWSIRVS